MKRHPGTRTAASGAALLAFIVLASPEGAARDVILNEIHYDPPDKTKAEEFVELHNRGGGDADLSGWFFSSGIRFTFPPGTTLGPGGFLVVAEDPVDFASRFGRPPDLGPYEGRLSNDGERVVLRDADGWLVDEVDYQAEFPWPLASAGDGSSMELIHPDLDNDLGGSWRASGYSSAPPTPPVVYLGTQSEDWLYRKGTSEASSPVEAWRGRSFVPGGDWIRGATSIGYGDSDDSTTLTDMQGGYTSIYLRHVFEVEDPEAVPATLKLRVYVDDGCIVWINGVEVARLHVTAGEKAHDDVAENHEASWEEVALSSPADLLVPGDNVIAVHALNQSLTSSDFSIDATILVPGSDEMSFGPPTPGAANSVLSANAPPQIRQVDHLPRQPSAGTPIIASAKVTDPEGVARVWVRYQIVSPGSYIPARLAHPHNVLLSDPTRPHERNPDYDDPSSWVEVELADDGTRGDQVAGDAVYSGLLPGQPNRTLLRYRIGAADGAGASIEVPYVDDRSLNFGCFIYDGVPPYTAATRTVQPQGVPYTYGRDVMSAIPVYFLLTRNADMMHCLAYDSSFQIPKSNEPARDEFNWEGTFVYEGFVYDHVRYRLRQANDRYGGSGKRSFRVRFNKGSHLRARDLHGERYPTRWRTLNIGKQFDNKRVGNFGLTETLNNILWNMVGVPAPHFHPFHFRVIDGPEEAPPGTNGQHLGDFWGLFSGTEDYDSHFIESHGLGDGNLYKLKDQIFDGNRVKRHQGRDSVTTDADFQNIRNNLRPERPDAWLDTYVDYERWYPYHAIVEAVRHYDFVPADSHLKNRAWFFEPFEGSPLGRLWTLPHDSDASWGPNWNQGIDYSKNAIFASPGKPAFKLEYRSVIREVRDLLWTQEVIPQMIDDLAAPIIELSRADRDRWRSAPPEAGSQDFGPIETKIQDMKSFAFVGWSGSTGPTVPAGGRAAYLDGLANAEGDSSSIPNAPVLTSRSGPGYPLDSLVFASSAFRDPQGNDTFGGMEWRVGEITDPAAPGYDPSAPRAYEWTSVWDSGVLLAFQEEVVIPPVLKVGHTYRIRARMRDGTGRWGHWSAPYQFTVSPPSSSVPEVEYLRVTELMYHPLPGSDLEFIELFNGGPGSLDLRYVRLGGGVELAFEDAGITELAPGEYVVLVENLDAFRARYDTAGLQVAEYSGQLSNGGERIVLSYGGNVPILDFTYEDWLPLTDGGGYSLVIEDPYGDPSRWSQQAGWRESAELGGSPGSGEGSAPSGGWQLAGDGNQDGRLDISDPVWLLLQLFGGSAGPLPCEGASPSEGGNLALLDVNGSSAVDLTDAVHVLNYLFQDGPAPVLGTACTRIPGCPQACGL